jgi:hypothetical protein
MPAGSEPSSPLITAQRPLFPPEIVQVFAQQ